MADTNRRSRFNESEWMISFYKGEIIRGLINSRNRGYVSP